jgi:bifunctional non-homologous end joining protein LigD
MLATLTDAPFDDAGWVFETKWDGFRLVASVEKRSVTL